MDTTLAARAWSMSGGGDGGDGGGGGNARGGGDAGWGGQVGCCNAVMRKERPHTAPSRTCGWVGVCVERCAYCCNTWAWLGVDNDSMPQNTQQCKTHNNVKKQNNAKHTTTNSTQNTTPPHNTTPSQYLKRHVHCKPHQHVNHTGHHPLPHRALYHWHKG